MSLSGGKSPCHPPIFSPSSTLFIVYNTFIRLGCGIDVSKDKLAICFGGYTASGQFKIIASRKSFKNTLTDIQKLIQWTAKYQAKHNASCGQLPFQVVMETTGSYHESVLHALYQAGMNVCLERAAKVKKFLLSLGQYSKNDDVDAVGICRLACERKLRPWKPFSPKIMELRSLLRHRNQLVKNRTRYKNQLHAITSGRAANRQIVKSLKGLIRQLDHQIASIEKAALKLYGQDEVLLTAIKPIVDSFAGVGWLSVLTVFTETNGFAGITSRGQLSRYAGLNVVQNQSGKSERRTRISKQGNSRIRAILYMCAMGVIKTKSGPLYRKYLRIVARNPKAKKVGVAALQRSILELIYTLYKTGKPYDADHVWGSDRPQANRPLNSKKNTPEPSSEVHGIADSEEPLPILAVKINSSAELLAK